MKPVLVSRIDGSFEGFADGRVFRLCNGLRWRQVGEVTHYACEVEPLTRLFYDGQTFYLDIEGTSVLIRVELAGSLRTNESAEFPMNPTESLSNA